MNGVVYYSHSYRQEDKKITGHFLRLIKEQNLISSVDPPASSFNLAKLIRHLNRCDGMISVLTEREGQPKRVSPFILYEIETCIKSKKPLLVFIEDTLDDSLVPPRILQIRFSRQYYFQQLREHQHSIRHFCNYLGSECPPRYQAHSRKKTCICIRLSSLESDFQNPIRELIQNRGYNIKEVRNAGIFSGLSRLDCSDLLMAADIALVTLDKSQPITFYLLGLLEGLSIPSIFLTTSELTDYRGSVLDEFKFHQLQSGTPVDACNFVSSQLSIFEQDTRELEKSGEIDDYINKVLSANSQPGAHVPVINIGSIMHQGGNVIDNRDFSNQTMQNFRVKNQENVFIDQINYNQVWDEVQQDNNIDFSQIIQELKVIRSEHMKDPEITTKIDYAIEAAKKQNGPDMIKILHEMMKEKTFKEKIDHHIKSIKDSSITNVGTTIACGALAVLIKAIAPF